MIKPACVDRLTMGGTAVTMPIRLVFCAQQRKDFPRLYNVQLAVISRDRPDEAMTARMTLRGVDRHTAATYVRLLAAAIE